MLITTEQAWEELHVPIKHFILTYIQDEATVEDILQDVFLKMHQHSKALTNENKLRSWLYQIARHTIYDYYRSHRETVPLSETFDLPEESLPENAVQALLPCLKDMVEQLPMPYREAIVLTEYQGLTQKELAQYLNLSFSGAKSRVQRGREKLKQMLLDCCHFVLDRRGGIIAYHPRNECCLTCSCNVG